MANASTRDDGQQRIVARSVTFFVVPTLLLVGLLLVLAWEILRANVAPQPPGTAPSAAPSATPSQTATLTATRPPWPWRLTLLGVAPAATLCGVIGGLLFARGQYARTTRPRLGWEASSDAENQLLPAKAARLVTMYNGGPGYGALQRIDFRIAPRPDLDRSGGAAPPGAGQWLGCLDATRLLASLSLKPDVDFAIRGLGPGLPLPAVKGPADGIQVAAFGRRAVDALAGFALRVRFADSVGDSYERTMEVLGA